MEKIGLWWRSATVILALLLINTLAWGRGGGGCLEEGTRIATPSGPKLIEQLKPGDSIWTVVDGQMRQGEIQSVSQVEPDFYIEIRSGENTLRATAEHPIETSNGIFHIAEILKPGDWTLVTSPNGVTPARISTVTRVNAIHPAYNLLVSPGGTYIANGFVVHNKGCFLPDTPITRADGSQSPICEIRPGDALLAFTTQGEIVRTVVRNIIIHNIEEYNVVTTPTTRLKVTSEHPFYVGHGLFKTLEALRPGDTIFVLTDNSLVEQPILGIETIHAPTRVYNLQTDHPNTYFAHGIAVHNKGGGCFPAGTSILTPSGSTTIEQLRPNDRVIAIQSIGTPVSLETKVEAVHATQAHILTIETTLGILRTTEEHPLLGSSGHFRPAGTFHPGEIITQFADTQLHPAVIQRMTLSTKEELVYNLTVGAPHTFIADKFVVHNKGGGGGGFHGGGGYHGSGGGSGNGTVDSDAFLILFLLLLGGVMFFKVILWFNDHASSDENLDYVYSASDVRKKADKTKKLIEFIAHVDQTMQPDKLEQVVLFTFTKLQDCWQSREYAPMQPLMMPYLYQNHLGQIRGLIRNHEINRIDGLHVDRIDLVNVRYSQKKTEREFTALITATARDYYVNDSTQDFLRGDDSPAQFQEFWTFQLQNDTWLLREIEQSRESHALADENFFEPFTDMGRDQVYGETATQSGAPGPWVSPTTLSKATKVERLLNFLVQTDKLWNRREMTERARKTFTEIILARENGDPSAIPADKIFPDTAASLRSEMTRLQSKGERVEFRNLCVRKVELVLIRNYSDNSKDEFIVRISAHAQRGIFRNGQTIMQEPYVTPFVEYWTFGRLDNTWKLKEALSESHGESFANAENLDEDSSPQQLQWYYTQTRAI